MREGPTHRSKTISEYYCDGCKHCKLTVTVGKYGRGEHKCMYPSIKVRLPRSLLTPGWCPCKGR